MNITVIGCGRWGSFLAWYLDRLGARRHKVTLYGRTGSARFEELRATRRNAFLELGEGILLEDGLAKAVEGADALVVSISSQSLRAFCRSLAAEGTLAGGKKLVLCMKGLEIESGLRLSEVAREELGGRVSTAVWVGPGHVQDFTKGIPNCMVLDSEDASLKRFLAEEFAGKLIRFYYGDDLIGNEIGAAAKNVVGIAAGMLDGLNRGALKGALMSRGTREIARLIAAMGGKEMSAYGLAHLGDYEATVFSPHSHNRLFGELFVGGKQYGELAEGVHTVRALVTLGKKAGVELPICEGVYACLYEGADAEGVLSDLFMRSRKSEF